MREVDIAVVACGGARLEDAVFGFFFELVGWKNLQKSAELSVKFLEGLGWGRLIFWHIDGDSAIKRARAGFYERLAKGE